MSTSRATSPRALPWSNLLAARRRLLPTGVLTGVEGNRVGLLVDGKQAFPAMLQAITDAQSSIVLESYIFAPDGVGTRFREALRERARAGVSVRVLVDGVGTGDMQEFFAPLVTDGGRVAVFHPMTFWLWKWDLWLRDHRKLLIVDSNRAFLGGLNIADAYAPREWQGEAWHDVHCEVGGPAVRELSKIFNRTWHRASGEPVVGELSNPQVQGTVQVQILEGRLTQRHSVRKAYLRAIKDSRHTVRICNAYFIPDRGILRALQNAVKRGVRVQLLLAGKTDIPAVRFATRSLYGRLIKAGIEVYEYAPGVLHAKVAVIDGHWCSIGSYNLDNRSLRHNLEVNIACVDETLGRDMDAEFERDLEFSERIDLAVWSRRSWRQKATERFFYSLRHFL